MALFASQERTLVVNEVKQRAHEETGFTLIELMVVVLIMGILMAIAIPTFLSTQGSANDASAKSNATNAFTGEKAYFEDNQTFIDAGSTANGTGATGLDPNLPWGANGAATGKGTVTALAGSTAANVFTEALSTSTPPYVGPATIIEAYSKSGDCFYIFDDETTSTSPVIAYAESSTVCAVPGVPGGTSLVASGNAGKNIVAGTPAKGNWYTSW
jgi:prepilin-type N-terminal cleavage/methylation domain-containing protein